MDVQQALQLIDQQVRDQQGQPLTDLQRAIIQGVWQGQRYGQIAQGTQYSEGHIKDVSAELWQILGQALGERVSKNSLRSVLERCQSINNIPQLEDPDLGLLGRSEAIAHLDQRRPQVPGIVIYGEGGTGKTRLAQVYLHSGRFTRVLQVLMAKAPEAVTPVQSLVAEWLQRDLGEEPTADLGICLSRLRRHLQQERIGVLIDNLEPALDRQGRLLSSCRDYRELLRVLWDPTVRSFTLITSRDRLCEPDITVEHYRLPGLDPQGWQQYFQDQEIPFRSETLTRIHQLHRGNPKAMGILAGAVREDFEGDLELYWQTQGEDLLGMPDLKNLVAEQFNRLQALDPIAYRLLCRLGCFRYQQIPTVDLQIIAHLLWDHSDTDARQLITSLKQRSLLEGSRGRYSLHPLIHSEAAHRLRQSPDWRQSHQQVAIYWTERIPSIHSLNDALQAWEAYYHYLTLEDYDGAARVILKARHNQWGQYLSLGGTLYRLGFSQQVLEATQVVIHHMGSGDLLSELHNLLADQQWISGQLQAAIQAQTYALELSLQRLGKLDLSSGSNQYYFQMLSLDSRLSLGLYALDLWDLQGARRGFEQVIQTVQQFQDPRHQRWLDKATIGLALIESIEGQGDQARQRLEPLLDRLETLPDHHAGHLAYFLYLIGQTLTYLQDWPQAKLMFQQTFQIATAGHYLQIQAKALTGLAMVARGQGSLDQALDHHQQAIALLQQIGAYCDLAEAYIQQGLTQQRCNSQVSGASWEQALQLYEKMKAPWQIDRIRQLQGPSHP